MAGILAIDGGRNWRLAPVPAIRRRPRIPVHHVALWAGGSLVRGFIRKHPYLSIASAAAAAGVGAYRYIRGRRVKKMATTPRYGAKRPRSDDAVYEGVGGGYVNDRHHKKTARLGRVNLRKLAREGVCAIYDRWQKMGVYGRQAGSYSFAKDNVPLAQDGTTTLTGTVTCPVYLWDISSCRNYFSGAEYVPYAGYQVLRASTGSQVYFNPLRGQNISTGVDGADQGTCQWQTYEAPRIAASFDSPLDNGILDWVKVQIVLYGARKTSHKIWIDVCQMDPELQPRAVGVNLGTLTSSALASSTRGIGCDEQTNTVDGYQWWVNELGRLIDGPFTTYGQKVKKLKFKVLSRKVVEFTPVSSYEEAGAALCHKQTVNMFLKMGRKHDFGWRNDVAPANVLNDTVIQTDVELGQHATVVHPNARVFLMMRSQVFNKVGDNAAFTADTDCAPSFDIRISRKWLISA